jgi:hypothetical protein
MTGSARSIMRVMSASDLSVAVNEAEIDAR